jgi:hypothetical protein
MESILKSDLFFFITSISVVVVSCFLVVALFYLIRILRNFNKISKILRNYAEDADTGLRDLGEQIRKSSLFTFIFGKEKSKKEENHTKKI